VGNIKNNTKMTMGNKLYEKNRIVLDIDKVGQSA
jgi:hypothetical protein